MFGRTNWKERYEALRDEYRAMERARDSYKAEYRELADRVDEAQKTAATVAGAHRAEMYELTKKYEALKRSQAPLITYAVTGKNGAVHRVDAHRYDSWDYRFRFYRNDAEGIEQPVAEYADASIVQVADA